MSSDLKELAKSLREIASGSVMLRVSNGVTVSRSMLVKAAESIEALRNQPSGAGVAVKPLEWEDADEGMCTKWRAAALGGHYELVNFGKDDPGFAVNFSWGRPLSYWFIQGEPNEWGPTGPKIFPTLEEAKAAAQSDYESRIRSALSHQPAPVTANASAEARLREALSDLIEYIERNECPHEETHRGGSIWTICSECGRKWADDQGGFVPYKEPSVLTRAKNALSHQPAPVTANASAEAKNYLYWAVGRWNAEVLNRPLQNIHRRSLDDTWRQVIRHFGGDDRELCGPTHDELLDGAHPHASDCAKQGWLAKDVEDATKRVAEWRNETTKSEGGVEGHARSTKADSARGEAGSAPSQDGSGLVQGEAGWRDISTAPKDGTQILLFTHHEADEYLDESFDAVQIGWWDDGNHAPGSSFHREAGWHQQKIGVATHWMPLPAPPIRSARDGGGDNVAHILRDAQAGKEVHRTL